MKEHLLELKNVNKAFNNLPILNNISLYLGKGEILSILGQNGAGKSTLIKIISGATPADSGEFFIDGQNVSIRNPIEAKKHGINAIYQELNLFEGLSVAENIFFSTPPTLLNKSISSVGFIDWKRIFEMSEDLCRKYGYSLDIRKKVEKLSMGEKQIVAILKALTQNSRILIMDEPSTALPENEAETLFHIISQIRESGISIIYITHNIEDTYKLSDRVIIMNDGEIVGEILKDELAKSMPANDLIRIMAGKDMKERYPKLNTNKSNELLRVEGFKRGEIFKDISLSLYRGEILGLTGLLGAGRSSIARAIFGADKKEKGEIYVKGLIANITSPKDAVKYGISFIPEDRMGQGALSHGNIANNITIANMEGTEFQNVKLVVNSKYQNLIANHYVKRLAIKCSSLKQTISQLSSGNQQKVMISRWLFANTEILLLDEPTKGLDIASKVEMYNIMNELSREGKGILFISSDLSEILGMCDRILVLYNGSIVKQLMRSEATKERILYYASGGK